MPVAAPDALRHTVARITRLCRWAIGLSCALVLLNQVLRGRLTAFIIVEDGPVEMLSAVAWGAATIIALACWLKAPRDRATPVALILIACALAGFLDEVSFGQRVFGWTMPVVLGKPIDGIHDFFDVGYGLTRDYLTGAQTAGVMAVCLVACSGLVFTFRRQVAANLKYSADIPFVVLAACFLTLALVIDLDFVGPEFQFALMPSLEETFELSAGWSILAGSLIRWIETTPER